MIYKCYLPATNKWLVKLKSQQKLNIMGKTYYTKYLLHYQTRLI